MAEVILVGRMGLLLFRISNAQLLNLLNSFIILSFGGALVMMAIKYGMNALNLTHS